MNILTKIFVEIDDFVKEYGEEIKRKLLIKSLKDYLVNSLEIKVIYLNLYLMSYIATELNLLLKLKRI